MTTAVVDRPTPTTEMGRKEAESITQAIKDNFDSLGSMLIQARDRKAYKALGYRTFEGYCKTEFGKSASNAYRLIEDAKVVAQLEKEIAKRYDEPIILNIPSACLRPLKDLPDISEKLKAIEYAKKLATAEGKKATKKHLEIAVFEISGKRSEDFRSAIQSLGFTRGVSVEATQTLKKDRGIITKVDKLGNIHVQFYSGGVKSVSLNASQLRILTDAEKPARPLNEITASKGDRVLIFAQGLEGKKGTIYQHKEGNQALVTVDGGSSPIYIAYAEMELVPGEQKDTNWDSELVWNTGKNTYYYFPQEDTIYSDKWPQGLALKPHSHEKDPIEFIKNWEDKFAGDLLEALVTPARLKTLALAQAIELPENEGKEFAADLIASLNQLFPHSKPKAMGISFSRTIDELTSGKKTQTRRAWQDDYAKNFIRYFDENIAIPALNKGRHRGGHELGFIKLTRRPYQQYLSEMSPIDLQEEGGMVATAQEFIDTYFEGQDKLVWVLHFEFLSTPVSNNTAALTEENQRLREQLAEAELAIRAMVNAAALRETTTKLLPINTTNISEPTLPDKTEGQIGLLVRRFEDEYRNGEPYQIIEIEGEKVNCLKPSGFTEWIHESNLRVVVDQPMIWELLTKDTTELVPKTLEQNAKFSVEVDTTEALDVDNVDATVDTAEALGIDNAGATVDTELKTEIAQQRKKANEEIARDNKKLASATQQRVKNALNKQINDSRNRLLELDTFEKIEIGQTVEKKIYEGVHGIVTKLDFSPGGLPQIWVKWSDKKYAESSNASSLNISPVISLPSSVPGFSIQKDINLLRENLLAWKAHAEEELAVAEEHNKNIFTQKLEARSASLEQLQKFSNLRVGQYVVDKLSPRRGKVIAMHAKTERLALEVKWESGKTELTPFRDIVPQQMVD
ncbi:MAG: hypothetical protein JGK17_06235 [Microcoleus sp. PH2017_10_PVI_O_A]|uniref:hypothetical protein n=1 Tax=unclassified Microcoleus TaxID=2642155 RepID=UPI001DA4265C|nr:MULTISPECIES: hypothetical protein [unclassified Microcoleus]TAE84467.1 MAG: hypothetical protein EAZ83_05785 [Oscillatoriales cyanobacterium]MCC3405185.1 hypothetical protein [Microcoleus sp. PH2017_10_PVI_O_A]MCC3459272.1 hypothetical protein [Microcoleus sp. PH2017_11_PCY_U_A]MCC3477413.1 hypothetical protein [Microcoleus sp. PH2017_12_PCY_D_A]MCC3558506.1 hypothetical protein [Microcoleus sp. PH2017_27_LUM_O_A]